MSVNPQTLFAAQKSSFDSFLALQNTVCQGVEKLFDLNLAAWKSSLDEAAKKSEQASKLNDVQDSIAFTSALFQPATEQSLAYGKQMYDICAKVQSDIARLGEERVEQARKEFAESIEQLAKTAPAGSESAIAMLQSSLASATNAYESISKVAKQATDAASANAVAAAEKAFSAAQANVAAAESAARTSRRADSK